jgi:hypothetical protein
MAIKYWHLKLKGVKSVDEVQAVVGGGGANIVRIHVEGGETHVYLAGDASLHEQIRETAKGVGGAQEVQASTVTKLA